jgi:hypothetical protein
VALTGKEPAAPEGKVLRQALFGWAERASLPVAELEDTATVRLALAACARELGRYIDRGAELLAEITRNPPSAVRAARQAIVAATGMPPSGVLGPAVDYPDLQLGIARILNPG